MSTLSRIGPSALLSLLVAAFALPHSARSAPDISVSFDREKGVAEVVIPARGGSVSLADLTRGLARARGYDDAALTGLLPDEQIPVDGVISAVVIVALNRALEPGLHFKTGDDHLKIFMDDEAVFASSARFRRHLLNGIARVFGKRPDPTDYGIQLPPGWNKKPVDMPLYVLVHGFNSRTDRMANWKKILEKRGHLVATFAYPNDQPALESAELLEETLKEIADDSPGRKVKVVAHSMGGLVSRAVIEDPERDPGCVDQLVMLATPNQESRLAHFAFGLEFWELVGLKEKDIGWVEEFYHAVEDGLCGAADDLKPDSRFLRTLNARPRNPDVRYAIFAGTSSPLPPRSNAILRAAFEAAPDSSRAKQFFGPKLDLILEDMHELDDGAGDGVVSLERTRLDGVKDHVVLPFNHDIVLEPDKVDGLTDAVLERLEK